MELGDELPHYQWNQLGEGDGVTVQREDQTRVFGKVDVVADDGSIFWIWLDNGNGRIAIYGGHETHVWLPETQHPVRELTREKGKSNPEIGLLSSRQGT